MPRLPFETTADFLQAARAFNLESGRDDCRIVDYIAEHIADPVADVVDHIYADPEFGPQMICEGIINSRYWDRYPDHSLEQAIEDQEAFANDLLQHTYGFARGAVEDMMRNRRTVFLSRKALETVLAYIRGGHPNPKAFLGRPHILAKIPADIDLTDYPCDDFPDMKAVVVKGTAP